MPGGIVAAGRFALGAVLLGMMAVVLNISLAAIVYQGEFVRFVDRGIALTLLGGAAMAMVAAFVYGYRGTVAQPQDTPAVILSLAAAGLAAGMADPGSERGFATLAALVAVTSLASGAAAWLLGRLHLGHSARFIPFPVIGGFLAATGYLLVMGALSIAVGRNVEIGNLAVLFEPGNPMRWLPWAALATGLTLAGRRIASPLLLPLVAIAAVAGFYAVLAALGIGFAEARDRGLLLGPFGNGGFLPSLAGWRPLDIDWRSLVAQVPAVLSVVGFVCVTALFSASALEVMTGTRIDPDRDLRGVGWCNLASAALAGPPGYQIIAWTMIGRSMGYVGRANGLIVAAACVAALGFGASAISAIPVGIVAMVVLVIGLGMLVGPLFDQRRDMPVADYAIVLIIPVVTAAFGFLWGVAVGLLAATLFFVVAFARIDLVRLETTAARMRSRVERPAAEEAWLSEHGRDAVIYVLAGYVFFGTAHRLVSRIEAALARDPRPRFVLIDLERVRGLDVSAARALAGFAEACRADSVTLVLSGLDPAGARLIEGYGGGGPRLAPRLEAALQEVEAAIIAGAPAAAVAPGLVAALQARHPEADVQGYFEAVAVPAGAEVITQGARSDFLLVLTGGLLRAEVTRPDGRSVTVARCVPGALVGEIGLYAGVPRTARVLAEAPSAFQRLDAAALARMERDNPRLLADLNRMIAAVLARRLSRTTALLADSELQSG